MTDNVWQGHALPPGSRQPPQAASDPGRRTNRDGTPRLADGALAPLVLAHLRRHPQSDFSPYELAKVLRRSHGTIRIRLIELAAAGIIIRTSARPARFQLHPQHL